MPYCDFRGEIENLTSLSENLRSLGVSCTIQKNYLRIQGIENCAIIAPYTGHNWFLDVMKMFEKEVHLTPDGILSILRIAKRNTERGDAISIEEARAIIAKRL